MRVDINGLRQKRAEKIDRMEAIVAAARDGDRDMTEVEKTAFDELKAEVDGLDDQIARAEQVAALKATTAQPVAPAAPGARAPAAPKAQEPKGAAFARIVRSLAAERGNPRAAAQFASEQFGDERIAKALAAGVGSAGGFMVPEEYSADIIELLRPASVVMSLQPTVMPMPRGTLSVPRLATGSSASYIGENTNAPKTEPTFGQLNLTARKLAALVPISNDLIRFSSPAADVVVRDDLVSAMSQAMDLSFIRGDGTLGAPKGLRHWAPSANVIPANATVNLANVTADLGKVILALKNANVRMIRPGWIMAPRTEEYLMTVRDGNGNFAFRDELVAGRLRGYPYRTTTQIPINLAGGSNNNSEIYFVDFADAVVGDTMQIMIDVSSEAAYHDGSNVVAAFSLDQTIVRAIAQHDFGMRHAASAAVLTTVTWTP